MNPFFYHRWKPLILFIAWVASIAVAFALGQFSGVSGVAQPSAQLGHFVGSPQTEWLDDRDMRLLQDFGYVDPYGVFWNAPRGSVINGASIPRLFWTWIGSPFTGRYRNASIIHDVACENQAKSSAEVHKMFFDACLAGGVPEKDARQLYFAVVMYGPRWELKSVYETRQEPGEDEPQIVTRMIPVDLTMKTPTPEDVARIEKLFKNGGPSVTEIEALADPQTAVP